jgi:hypothetical protein
VINPDLHVLEHGIFGIALPQSIRYARANISYLDDESGERLTGYIPIIVAKCGSYLKEEGLCGRITVENH